MSNADKERRSSCHPLRLVFFEMPDLEGGRLRKNPSPLANELKASLKDRLKQSLELLEKAKTTEELMELLQSDAAVHGLLCDVTLKAHKDIHDHKEDIADSLIASLSDFLSTVHKWKPKLPVLLIVERGLHRLLGHAFIGSVSECLFLFEDTTNHIAGRVVECLNRYWQSLVPPFASALYKYSMIHEFSFAAPGHQGGVAFRKTTVGRTFYDYYNENLFRSDMGIERTQLGSLLEHTGAIGESERYAACVFGSHQSYSGVVGTSGSNRTLLTACLTERDIVLCDRNCHKSIEQGLIISGATPVYLVPTSNSLGVIGPIPREKLSPAAIQQAIRDCPIAAKMDCQPIYSVITNCTYDGICYDAVSVSEALQQTKSIDFMHFDEAWFAYARFHPLYRRRHSMHGRPEDHDKAGPTVFATQSTHKLLAALSQASYIHVRNGRRVIESSIFNEAYMMHTTTSPLYAIVASNDIATAIMDHDGLRLVSETITEAVLFRQQLTAIYRKARQADSWFFRPWNAETVAVPDGAGGEVQVPFEEAPMELLASDPHCWELRPGEAWHGFTDLQDDGYAMLDPIKIGIVTPGLDPTGKLEGWGVPAALLSKYLSQNGIVVARTMDYQVLVMFSIGVTHGKWSTLLSVLHNFKVHWEENAPVREVLRELYLANPRCYANVRLKELGSSMWEYMRLHSAALKGDFSKLPLAVMTPRQAQQRIRDNTRVVTIQEAAGMVAATSVIPYPPGIPLVMPGESFGPEDGPYLQYLLAKEAWDARFPGFETETEGIEVHEGKYQLLVIDSEGTNAQL